MGGDDKGANLSPLFENIKHFDIVVYAIGSNTKKIVDFCKENSIKVFECLYLEIAVQKIDKNMKDDSIAILSPAAASLDQFKSYAQRGEIFKEFVKNLS